MQKSYNVFMHVRIDADDEDSAQAIALELMGYDLCADIDDVVEFEECRIEVPGDEPRTLSSDLAEDR